MVQRIVILTWKLDAYNGSTLSYSGDYGRPQAKRDVGSRTFSNGMLPGLSVMENPYGVGRLLYTCWTG